MSIRPYFIRRSARAILRLCSFAPILVCGCRAAGGNCEPRADGYIAVQNRQIDQEDRRTRMYQLAATRFPEVYRFYQDAFANGKRICHPKVIRAVPATRLGGDLGLGSSEIWLAFVVAVDGTVLSPSVVVDGPEPSLKLAAAAIAAIKAWRFTPATYSDIPSPYMVCLSMRFESRRR